MSVRSSLTAWPAYFLTRLASGLVQILPLAGAFSLGSWLGGLAWHLAPWIRRDVLHNLRIAFGREWSAAEIQACARQHFRLLGANLLSGIKAAAMDPKKIARHVQIEIPETVRQRRREKPGGLVALVSHQSNWELFAHLGHLFSEVPLGSVYQPLENSLLDAYLRKVRSRSGVRLFSRREGFMETLAFLREGCLAVLIDQHAGDGGVWTPLFDRLASTTPLAAMLALRAGKDLMPIAVQTIGHAHWKITASELLLPQPGEDAEELTARINMALEKQIRQSPADWLWEHGRWKTPVPRFLLGTHSRGVSWPPGYDPQKLQRFRLLVCADHFAAAAAVRSIRDGRPDLEMTLAVPVEELVTWKILVPGTRVVAETEVAGLKDHFEAAILLGHSIKLAKMLQVRKIPRRVGFNRPELRPYLNQWISVGKAGSRRQRFMSFAEKIGAAPVRLAPRSFDQSDLTTVFQQARVVFDFAALPGHLERLTEPGTTPEITGDGRLRIHSTFHSVRFVLHHLRLPAEHRIFLKIQCDRPYNDWMQVYYLTDTEKEFSVSRMVEKRDLAPGWLEEIFELPPDDLSGSVCITVGRGPAEYLVHNVEVRAVPIPPVD